MRRVSAAVCTGWRGRCMRTGDVPRSAKSGTTSRVGRGDVDRAYGYHSFARYPTNLVVIVLGRFLFDSFR